MLPRDLRLPVLLSRPFTTSFRSNYFLLRIRENELDKSRFGFVVSKKVDKRAVVRNQVSRKFQHSIKELLPRITPGYDLLFIPSVLSITVDLEILIKDIEETLKKRKIIL